MAPTARHRISSRPLRNGAVGMVLLLQLLVVAGCATIGVEHERSVYAAPQDEVLAAPSDDPLKRLLMDSLPPSVAAASGPELDVEALADLVHEQVNAVRHAHGLAPLGRSGRLDRLATAHSRNMAEEAYFGHVNLVGDGPTERAERMRLPVDAATVYGVGENLYLTHRFWEYSISRSGSTAIIDWKTAQQLARQTVQAWLNSDSHRANLLCTVYRAHGIGVAAGDNKTLFFTQNLSASPLQ